jgi:hypothetical protein
MSRAMSDTMYHRATPQRTRTGRFAHMCVDDTCSLTGGNVTSGRAVVGRGTLTAAGAEERRIHPEEEEAGAAWSRPTGATFHQRQVAGEAGEVRHCRDCGEGCGVREGRVGRG